MVKKSYLAKKDKELKLEVIKKFNPKLYDKVKAGEMEIQDAYVQTMMRIKWIQSTGQTSTQAVSQTPTQGSAIM